MRLYTFVTLCACALYVRAASIPSSEKKNDDLDNVDLENVESELVDQPTVQEPDNNLRKASDIPVKVVEEPFVLDENSNDYVPNKDESINIKRLEIDLNNPGPPQRQEHETQNPENYGGKERAVFAIIQKTKEAQSVFTKGIKEVSDSLNNLNKGSGEFPVALQNLKNLNESFCVEIENLNDTIRNYLESESAKLDGEPKQDAKVKFLKSNIQNIDLSFKFVVNMLNEGVELLSIIREEDESIKTETKALIKEENESVKQSATDSAAAPAAPGPSNFISTMLSYLQNIVNNGFTNITSTIQNQGQQNGGGGGNIINLIQGINSPSNNQGSGNKPPTAQQPTKPSGAQSDEPASPSKPQAQPWGPQAFYQQVQNLFQQIVNSGQGGQQNQQGQAPAQQASSGPFATLIQNFGNFISRPGQAGSQQPANSNSKPDTQGTPPKIPIKESDVQADAIPSPVSASAESPAPEKTEVSQPLQATIVPQATPDQQAVLTPEQPANSGPIQQLVQNNPIIKGIQSAVQRLQGSSNSETPRNEIIENDKKEKEELENKGHYGSNNANQGDTNDSNRVDGKIEEQKEEAPAAQEAAVENGVKAEETKPLTSSDKTE